MEQRGFKCEWCGLVNKANHLHHKKSGYKRLGKERPKDVMVLCENCHSKIHNKLYMLFLKIIATFLVCCLISILLYASNNSVQWWIN